MSRMHNPAHPGEVLREFLPKDLPVGEVASRLGVSRQALVSSAEWARRRQRRDGPAARSCAWHQCGDVGTDAGKSRSLAGAAARETEGASDSRLNFSCRVASRLATRHLIHEKGLRPSLSSRFRDGLRENRLVHAATPQAGHQGLEIRAFEPLKVLSQTAAYISAYQWLVARMSECRRYKLQIVNDVHRHAQCHGNHRPIFSQAFGNSLRILHKAGFLTPSPSARR